MSHLLIAIKNVCIPPQRPTGTLANKIYLKQILIKIVFPSLIVSLFMSLVTQQAKIQPNSSIDMSKLIVPLLQLG